MKRFITILLAISILFIMLAGCNVPIFSKPSVKPLENLEGQSMVKAAENVQTDSSDSDKKNAAGDESAQASDDSSGEILSAGMKDTAAADVTQSAAQADTGNQDALAKASAVSTEDVTTDDKTTDLSQTKYPVTVYYQDGDGYLVPMTRWILLQQGIARAAVSLCIDSAIAREEVAYYGVYPVIPMDTDILGIDIKDGVATIDFDRNLLSYNSAVSEKNIVASIVYTLTEFKTINKVRILVNGYPQDILKYGTNISGALERKDININGDGSLVENGHGKVDVFLFKKANEGFTYLVPVSVNDSEFLGEMPENLIEQLLAFNGEDELFSELPNGVELLDCGMQNGVFTLNFSAGFGDYGGSMKEEGILKQLAYTLRQVEGIKAMKLFVEGQKAELPEGTDISSGVVIPVTINDVIDL